MKKASTAFLRAALRERLSSQLFSQLCSQARVSYDESTYLVRKPGRLRLHVVLTLLLVEFALLFRRGVLVLLVLGDQVVHVALSLRELHLVHALTRVPVKEGLAAEHTRELLRDALEHLLDRRRVPD